MDGIRTQLLINLVLLLPCSSREVIGLCCDIQMFPDPGMYPGCERFQNRHPCNDTELTTGHNTESTSAIVDLFVRFHGNDTCFPAIAVNAPNDNGLDILDNYKNCRYSNSVYYHYMFHTFANDGSFFCYCYLVYGLPGATSFTIQAQFFNSAMTNRSKVKVIGYPRRTFVRSFDWDLTETVNKTASIRDYGVKIQVVWQFATFYLQLHFQVSVDCEKLTLHVTCSSKTSGYIETPGWNNGENYPNSMNSCVSLHVPENHVTMISLVSMDLEWGGNGKCYDTLAIYKSNNCTGVPETGICKAQDLPPSVINETRFVSFRFSSSHQVQRAGFRLLYSFHNSSEEPQKLSDGLWNCSGNHYDSFQQHFACLAETYCSDLRDKFVCSTSNLCGPRLVTSGGCRRIFIPLGLTTWKEASKRCQNFNYRLADLKDPLEWRNVSDFVLKTGKRPIFIGLRASSRSSVHELYSNTWRWSDNTLAVNVSISSSNVDPPYCAVLLRSKVEMINCDTTEKAAFLCETDFASNKAKVNTSGIVPHTPSGWSREKMRKCRPTRYDHMAHDFLACDVKTNCSARNPMENMVCSHGFSPPVPFFTCRNQAERVPYTLVCDFRSDCCDKSDEDFCLFPPCDGRSEFECDGNQQCIPSKHECNGRRDCVDGSDELNCAYRLDSLPESKASGTAVVDFDGNGSFNITPLANNTCPETHFQCPGGGYCMPVYVRCNGVYDCPGKEDEMDCDNYTCPGFYRCRDSRICLHEQHLCDGVFQCPQHDDELMCDFTCPEHCRCYGHAFICSDSFAADDYPELRYVDASGTGMKPETFLKNTKLIHLGLQNCGIVMIMPLNFSNLQSIDLSYNNIGTLESNQLSWLKNLVSLSLAHNLFLRINSLLNARLGFVNVIHVNVSGIAIPQLSDGFLKTFPNVKYLNMSGSRLENLTKTGFKPLHALHTLDVRGCPLKTLFPDVFDGLEHLDTIYTDNYDLCCPALLPPGMESERCHAPPDELSSCDALLREDYFRAFLTLYALLALIGNAGSFVYRVCIEKSGARIGYEVFVTHLSVADFLMGTYLAIIGIADRVYMGDYHWKDEEWKHSAVCKVAGFLSLLSSEVSAFLVCLITLERFLVIRFPHKNLRFSQRFAHAASVTIWFVGLTLAVIPLLPMTSHWHFYSQSGICIPLPITRKEFDGKDYAFAVMIVTNFLLFLFIAAGQCLIYWSVRINSFSSTDSARKSRERAIARRLFAVVLTDFMCWFPIGLLGVLARYGVPVSGDINVVMAIIVLPFNSALNPFLYTLQQVMERTRNNHRVQDSRDTGEASSSRYTTAVFDIMSQNRNGENYSNEEAFLLFKTFLEDGRLTPEQIRQHVWDIYEG